MRELFITDIHSNFTKFKKLLRRVEYKEDEDLLILGGDYFDRGLEADSMAKWLEKSYNSENIVLLRGNHDLALIKLLTYDKVSPIDDYVQIQLMIKSNDLDMTLSGLLGREYNEYKDIYIDVAKEINERYPKLLEVLQNTKFYHETDKAIYTHAYLPKDYKTASSKSWEGYVWRDSFSWAHSQLWKTMKTELTKKVVIGHFSLSNLPQWDGYNPHNLMGITFADGGLAWGYDGVINIIE